MNNAMCIFCHYFSRPPSLEKLPLKPYKINFSLDALVPGVDNIHIDVHISPQVHNAVKLAASLLMIKHSQTENFFTQYSKEKCENEKNALKHVCTNVLLEGINRAKSLSEVQIDFLVQASMAKIFLEEIKNQYEKFIANIEYVIRNYELSHSHDPYESFKLKEQLTEIKYNQKRLLLRVGEELFQIMAGVHDSSIRNIRESNFQSEHVLPDNFFLNPMLLAVNVVDDLFLIEAYALFGQRSEDPDNYQNLKSMIYGLLGETDLIQKITYDGDSSSDREEREEQDESIVKAERNLLDPWIMEVDNIDLMFNYFNSQQQHWRASKNKEAGNILGELKSQMKNQEKLLNLFYHEFKKRGVLQRIVAAYEMISVYRNYFPPMRPRQVREFLVNPSSRKAMVRQLKGRKTTSFLPLYKTIRQMRKCSAREKKEYCLNFLKHFSRYHRDLYNSRLLKSAMDTINLIKEEKMLRLSRENRSLHEFLLPDEKVQEEKNIISHVIIKADIRGSVDITYMMRNRGLNPASYFSLNFFEPISEILFDYGGFKEFIEGDAIILSIFEHEDTPQGWYSVARACGLAIRMLHIVEQYNLISQKNSLPILELGIGICYEDSHPTFLFDGDSRIIISPAINLADRLSGCSKILRERFKSPDRIFNLFVYESVSEEEIAATADDLSLRYNVNGIELNQEGFAKLSKEINLKNIAYKSDNNENVTLFTGTVPTLTGKYQRLVIREADVLKVNHQTMEVIDKTSKKYYEVCTNAKIYEFVEGTLGS
jgi:class 3 adenylate cyclase